MAPHYSRQTVVAPSETLLRGQGIAPFSKLGFCTVGPPTIGTHTCNMHMGCILCIGNKERHNAFTHSPVYSTTQPVQHPNNKQQQSSSALSISSASFSPHLSNSPHLSHLNSTAATFLRPRMALSWFSRLMMTMVSC